MALSLILLLQPSIVDRTSKFVRDLVRPVGADRHFGTTKADARLRLAPARPGRHQSVARQRPRGHVSIRRADRTLALFSRLWRF